MAEHARAFAAFIASNFGSAVAGVIIWQIFGTKCQTVAEMLGNPPPPVPTAPEPAVAAAKCSLAGLELGEFMAVMGVVGVVLGVIIAWLVDTHEQGKFMEQQQRHA